MAVYPSASDTLKADKDTIQLNRKFCQNRIPLDLNTRIAGEYSVNLEINTKNCQQRTTKKFRIQYQDLPRSITNIDEAIEQLRYIATGEEMETMRRAFHSAKEGLFKKFWKERDPTPGTEANEQMIEYYRRVDYANQKFSTQRPGWMTDRGLIYIKYGDPSEIIRNLLPKNQRPYEIWIYHEHGIQFEFVDRTGFGDYELMGPISEW